MKKTTEQFGKQLIYNRLMRNREETSLFEEAMDELFEQDPLCVIPLYIKAFDDNTEDFEVMFGMIHGIEAYDNVLGMENSMNTLLRSVHLFREEAKEWRATIFTRILNDEKARIILKSQLSKITSIDKDIVVSTLKSIKEEDENEYGKLVDEITS